MAQLPRIPIGWGCIVADPPWPYDTRVNGTVALQQGLVADGSRRMQGVSKWDYEPMSLQDIKGMEVGEIAAKNSHLWLWTTNAFMDSAFEVTRAWGFKPKTILTWVKVQHADPTRPSMKTGYWLRGASEHVILAVRGSCPKPKVALPTVMLEPRISRHSEKPDRFYEEYARQISPGPRLEMFARKTRRGWFAWGDQVVTEED